MPHNAAELAGRTLDLAQFIPYRLSVLSNRISNAFARAYSARFDMTIPEWRVMAVLGSADGLSARDVAERTAMDKVQVSRALARLVSKKRVQRAADMEDARFARLSLTPKGRAIYDEIVPLALGLEDTLVAALTPAERASLERIMAKLARQLRVLGEER
ncbi:MAG TPA: MarR family winged helix-turn-helix transcriptional regulator [Rhizomicrobium sp.]|nr:MarR family winged helix-turn-helix transcriptional regulator [Rhizomicrobium sp.]